MLPTLTLTELQCRLLAACVGTETGCWHWQRSHNSRGYGQIRFLDKILMAHRVSYEEFVGPIGDKWVLHRCDVPSCLFPGHLFLGDHDDNMADMTAKRRHANTLKTHCVNGHLFTDDNIYLNRRGARECRTCRRARHVAHESRRKGDLDDLRYVEGI